MVIHERHAEIARTFPELRHQATEAAIVVRDDRTSLRPLVDHLEIQPARILDEFRVARVRRELLLLARRIDDEVAARQRDERQAALREQLAERGRFVAPARERAVAGPQLNSPEAHGGDVFDRLHHVVAPRDRGVSVLHRGRRR